MPLNFGTGLGLPDFNVQLKNSDIEEAKYNIKKIEDSKELRGKSLEVNEAMSRLRHPDRTPRTRRWPIFSAT